MTAAEDQGGKATLAAIRERFGPEVAEIVDVCTDAFEDPKPSWWPRKRAYCERLLKAPMGRSSFRLRTRRTTRKRRSPM